jgi:hypothetical protein
MGHPARGIPRCADSAWSDVAFPNRQAEEQLLRSGTVEEWARVGALTWGGDLKMSAHERVGRSNRENRIALPHCGTAGRRPLHMLSRNYFIA